MTETKLRKATTSTGQLEESLRGRSQGQVSVQSVSSRTVETVIDHYPFLDQKIVYGRLSYQEESEYTSGRTVPIDFEFRTDSNLFLTEIQIDISSIDSVTAQLAEASSSELNIYRNLHAPEDALWDFLMTADRVLEITVLEEGEEVRYDDIEGVNQEDVVGTYAIENASVGFVEGEHEIYVKYRGGGLQIETDWEHGREYILQIFEREVLSE